MLTIILSLLLSISQYEDYRIGYSTNYSNGQYNTSYFEDSKNTESNTPKGGQKRSPQRPFSGNWLEDLEDWTRMNGVLGFGYDENWPSYVDNDYWLQFLSEYPEYEDEAEKYFVDRGQTPPWKTPIGDPIVLIMFALLAFAKIVKDNIAI